MLFRHNKKYKKLLFMFNNIGALAILKQQCNLCFVYKEYQYWIAKRNVF